jgi:hypothetical protein
MANYTRYNFANPTVGDVNPVNPVLTSLSIGFKNEEFMWDKIAPQHESDLRSGTFPVYTRDAWFKRQGGAERAANSQYLRVDYGVSTDTFVTVEIGYEKILPDVVRNSNQFGDNLESKDVAFLTNLIELEIEKRVAAATFVTGVWGTSNTLSGTSQWSDFANSDPIADADTAIRTILRNTGSKPKNLFMGLLAWEKLKEHPLVLDKYKHTQVGVMTEGLVAAVLGVDMLTVGSSVENTAAEGQVFVGADIWTDNVLFQVVNPPSLDVAASAFTIMWNERGNIPWAVESYREEQTRGDINRVFTHIAPKIVSSQHGYLFLDAVA